MGRVREIRRLRRRVRVGAPDPALTPVSGLAAVTELVDRLGMIERLDAAVGPIKTRRYRSRTLELRSSDRPREHTMPEDQKWYSAASARWSWAEQHALAGRQVSEIGPPPA